MPKVSFRMTSASHESAFRRTDQHGAEKSSVRPHRGRLTTTPSGCCVRKGTPTDTLIALSRHFAAKRRSVCRKPGSVMCAGEGTTTGTAPRPCRRRRGPPGRTQALLPGTDCPAPRNPPDHHVVHRHDLMQSRGADGTEA